MKCYDITRTRLVTERFRVIAHNENEAYDALSMDNEFAEKIEESTQHSSSVTNGVEELDELPISTEVK